MKQLIINTFNFTAGFTAKEKKEFWGSVACLAVFLTLGYISLWIFA